MFYSSKSKVVLTGKSVPFTCDVCDFVLRDKEDVKSVIDHGSCTNCTQTFKFVNLEKWKKGWRPSIEEARTTQR